MCENLEYKTEQPALLELRVRGDFVLKNPLLTGMVVEKAVAELANLGSALGLQVDVYDKTMEEFVLRVRE